MIVGQMKWLFKESLSFPLFPAAHILSIPSSLAGPFGTTGYGWRCDLLTLFHVPAIGVFWLAQCCHMGQGKESIGLCKFWQIRWLPRTFFLALVPKQSGTGMRMVNICCWDWRVKQLFYFPLHGKGKGHFRKDMKVLPKATNHPELWHLNWPHKKTAVLFKKKNSPFCEKNASCLWVPI